MQAKVRKPKSRRNSGKRKRRDVTPLTVHVTNDAGDVVDLTTGPSMQDLAMRWRYVLSRRFRWKHSAQADNRRAACRALEALTEETLDSVLRTASIVEIAIPYERESTAWEARVAPWEFLVTSAAEEYGNDNTLTVVRWLRTEHPPATASAAPAVLYVECTPGRLDGYYDFTAERSTLEGLFGERLAILSNPTLAELATAVRTVDPDIVHLAGIDNNQAKELLDDAGELPEHWRTVGEQDGVVLRSDDEADELGLTQVDAETLAEVINAGARTLRLVTANVYHSASRICALAVAEGASLAIGFQDTVNDVLAEVVLHDFYRDWLRSADPLAAFVGAMDSARGSVSLSGTGVVLWSSTSLVGDAATTVADVRSLRREHRRQTLSTSDLAEWFDVDVRVRQRLNYSLLHNDSGGLFEMLAFRKQREGILRDVNVEVVLYLGSESHPYNATFTLTEFLTRVDGKIKVPLTSAIIRTVSEPLRTSLFVRVSVAGQTVYQDTHRVTLLPADEWRDTDDDRIWLPSFVLPRDRCVADVIDRAQKHLITLSDDRNRGFDGYQSVDPTDPLTLANVDLQAQAIWAAVVNDFGIRYINPPPSYTTNGQRLRTPSQVTAGGRGTCIDLALFLAACLEYVEIYPVVFLLEGHAFAGYWRSSDRYSAFMRGRQAGLEGETMLESIGSKGQAAWILPSDSYAEVLNEVNLGFLYPLETVGFTTHGSFWEAIEEGVDNLRSRSEFHSLIDIWMARSAFITPLPILDEIGSPAGAQS